MANRIEGRARELIEDKNFGTVATLGPDGTVQLNVVWVDTDGEHLLINSAEGRAWPANIRRDPRVTVSVPNRDNPYEYVTVKGKAVEITPQSGNREEHIDALAKKYLDKDVYPFRAEGEVRLLIRVRPDRVSVWGGG